MSTSPPSSLGGDQETSMDDEVTPTTAKPLTELGGEAEKDAHKNMIEQKALSYLLSERKVES